MTSSRSVLKWAVVASSVLLVSGFICYQAGAFNWLTRPRPTAGTQENNEEMFGGSKSRLLLGGSKSDILVDPKTSPPGPSDGTLILGTKSAPIFTPTPPPQPTPGAEKSEPKGATEKKPEE